MAAPNISTPAGRKKLKPRHEPYWVKIAKNRSLGFRRAAEGGTWVARYDSGGRRAFNTFGSERDIPDHEEALAQALAWFRDIAAEGVSNAHYTVGMAISDYVAHLRQHNSERAAIGARQSAGKHIIPTLGPVLVTKITTKQIKDWHASLYENAVAKEMLSRKAEKKKAMDSSNTGDRCPDQELVTADPNLVRQKKDTANRILTILKAALSLAFNDQIVRSDTAWRRVKPFKDVGRARDVFLSQEQCTALLDACEPDFRVLVRSGLLTGARMGEIATRVVGDFDPRQAVLQIREGKTGARDCVLSDEGVAHFKVLSKDKLPSALLHMRSNGEAWGTMQVSRAMKLAVTKAKLPSNTCFYTLRHTYASFALLAGVNAQVLAENLGTSVRMIELHYGKFQPSDRRAMFNTVKVA